MLNYVLLIGLVTKITHPDTSDGKTRPGKINITFDNNGNPLDTNFTRITVWNQSLLEELEFFKDGCLPVIAYCSLKGQMYTPKNQEGDNQTEQKPKFYFDLVLNKIGYFGEKDKPLISEMLPSGLVGSVWKHGQKLEELASVNWWDSDSWGSNHPIPKPGDPKPQVSEAKKTSGDTLKETEEFIKTVDAMESTPEDSPSKDDNQNNSQDQNT